MSVSIPIIEISGEEWLRNNPDWPLLEMKEIDSKAISVNAALGYVFVVRNRRGERELVHLARIQPTDLKIRRPHPQHPLFHTSKKIHIQDTQLVDSQEN